MKCGYQITKCNYLFNQNLIEKTLDLEKKSDTKALSSNEPKRMKVRFYKNYFLFKDHIFLDLTYKQQTD